MSFRPFLPSATEVARISTRQGSLKALNLSLHAAASFVAWRVGFVELCRRRCPSTAMCVVMYKTARRCLIFDTNTYPHRTLHSLQ